MIKKEWEMTTGERGQHQNVSGAQSFLNSNEQNGKVAGSGQKLLLISEVQWDLQKKQWRVAGEQQHDTIQEHCDLQSSEPRKTQVKRRRRKKTEDRTNIDEQRLFEKGPSKKKNNSVGGLDHLLILAHSAELLSGSVDNCLGAKNNQYKDKKCKKKPLEASGGLHNVEVGKSAFPFKGKIRLTHLRCVARSKKHLLVQEIPKSQACVHADPKSSVDSQHVEKVAADQAQEARGHQDVEAVLAKCYSQMVDGMQHGQIHKELDWHASGQTKIEVNEEQREHQNPAIHAAQGRSQIIDFRQPCIAASRQNGQQQLILPHHISTCQPLQMTDGPLLWNDKSKGSSMKQHISISEHEQSRHLVKDQIGQIPVNGKHLTPHGSEIEKNPKLMAREKRKLRTHRRKKHPKEQQIQAAQESYHMADAQMHQMYKAGQQCQWDMWNFQNWKMWEIEQQRSLQNPAGKPLNGNCLIGDKYVFGGSQHPHVVTRADQGKLQSRANNNSEKCTIIEFQRDHESMKAYMKPKKTTSVEGRTRVSHLKREARLKNRDTMETKQHVQFPVESPNQ